MKIFRFISILAPGQTAEISVPHGLSRVELRSRAPNSKSKDRYRCSFLNPTVVMKLWRNVTTYAEIVELSA